MGELEAFEVGLILGLATYMAYLFPGRESQARYSLLSVTGQDRESLATED
jgi:hypothetical protein